MKKTFLALAVAAVAQGFAMQASAATLTFESLAAADDNYAVGTSYTEQGFLLEDLTEMGLGFATWGTDSLFYSGSTSLINDNDTGGTRLSQVSGGAFTLTSIDLATMYFGYTEDGSDVTFFGTRADSSTVSQTFHITDGAVQTFTFSGFTDLAYVEWTNDAMYHQFDNINVAAVPEPETYAMFLAGLGLLGFMARRRA